MLTPRRLLPPQSMLGGAPTVAQNIISELGRMQTDAPNGIHFLAFVGGFLLVSMRPLRLSDTSVCQGSWCVVLFRASLQMVSALINMVTGIFKLSPMHAFFSFAMFLFGLVTLALEQQGSVFPPIVRAHISQYFLFLTLISGRGKRARGVFYLTYLCGQLL